MSKNRTLIIVLSILLVIAVAAVWFVSRAVPQKAAANDPAASLGEPDGQDSFTTSDNWTLFDTDCFKSMVSGGKYVMTAKGVKDYSCWEVTWPSIENFYLEVEVQNPQDCNSKDAYGVLFRAPDNYRGYLYGLTCGGEYYLDLFDGQATTRLILPTLSPSIVFGAGKVNRMGIAAYGGQYQLYVNGIYQNRAFDSTYIDPGKIGFFVRAATERPFTVAFDNLKIWELSQNIYPPSQTPPDYPSIPSSSGAVTGTATDILNVRSGPSTDYPILGVVPEGATGEILGYSSDYQWYAVTVPTEYADDGMGWVSGQYVSVSNSSNQPLPVITPPLLPPSAGLPPTTPDSDEPAAVALEPINVRSGPGNDYPSYGVIPAGASMSVNGVSPDEEYWVIVVPTTIAPDGMGWVPARYCSASNTGSVPVVQPPAL